jgi:hypothetical protein
MAFLTSAQSVFLWLRSWAKHHGGEVFWAAVFAGVFGVPLAVYFAKYVIDVPSFKIYLVAGSHYLTKSSDPSLDTKQQFTSMLSGLKLGDSDVTLKVIELPDDTPETARAEAAVLADQPDTLLVIGHLDSGPT